MILNKKWHSNHPFPHGKNETDKNKWRAAHRKSCGCGRKKKTELRDCMGFEQIKNSKYIIISIIGPHANEGLEDILQRKKNEITDSGKSFWLIRSPKPAVIQDFCKCASSEQKEVYCLFILGKAQPAATAHHASEFSVDGKSWVKIPDGIKVTGKVKLATAYVFSAIEVCENGEEIDLWDYSTSKQLPIRFNQTLSNACCTRMPSIGMKSRLRKVVGVAKLVAPFAVEIR